MQNCRAEAYFEAETRANFGTAAESIAQRKQEREGLQSWRAAWVECTPGASRRGRAKRSQAIYASMYCASPLPKDQFSQETSTRLTTRSCGRRPGASARISAMRLKSLRFC